MKFVVERDALQSPFGLLAQLSNKGLRIPILEHVLFDARGDSLRLLSHNLDSSCQCSIKAEVHTAGSYAIPAAGFAGLLNSFPKGSQITVDASPTMVSVKCGRSNYRFPTLPAIDFPLPIAIFEGGTILSLTGAELTQLMTLPRSVTWKDASRQNLRGVFLHADQSNHLAAAGSNGVCLLKTSISISPPSSMPSVIIPNEAIDKIVDLATEPGATFRLSPGAACVTVGRFEFATKLIDATFPDYERLTPSLHASPLAVDRKDLIAVLQRLGALDDKGPTANFAWDDSPAALKVTVRGESGGEDEIDCDGGEAVAGGFSVFPKILLGLLTKIDSELVELHCTERPRHDSGSMRLVAKSDPSIIAVFCPCVPKN